VEPVPETKAVKRAPQCDLWLGVGAALGLEATSSGGR
jgi:hypothetical protein